MCQRLFFNKVAGLACNFIKKEHLAQIFSCEFCEISQSTFFTEHLRATAFKHYITPTKKDFDPDTYILHVGKNDITLGDTPEEITEHIVNIATSLKTENNPIVISNIVRSGDGEKEMAKQLTNYWPTSAIKKKYLWQIMTPSIRNDI